MIIKCYIIDDESDAIGLLKEYIEQTPGLELVGSSQDPLIALDEITGTLAPGITFMDVDMRQLSGMELAGMVNLYTTVVFTTGFTEYALQAFEIEAFDYLLKPINYERFLKCIQRAKRKMRQPVSDAGLDEDFFNIKSEIKGRMVKIRFEEVIYVEGAANYIQIHTSGGKHMTYLTMKDIEQALPQTFFARIHRSFIVNVNYVRVIERNRLKLDTGEYLTMGDYYKDRFLAVMDERLVKTSRPS